VRKQAFAQAFEEEKDFTANFLCCFGMLWKNIYIHMFLQKFPVLDSILAGLEKTNQDMAVQSDFRKSTHFYSRFSSQPPNTVFLCLFQGRDFTNKARYQQGSVTSIWT